MPIKKSDLYSTLWKSKITDWWVGKRAASFLHGILRYKAF